MADFQNKLTHDLIQGVIKHSGGEFHCVCITYMQWHKHDKTILVCNLIIFYHQLSVMFPSHGYIHFVLIHECKRGAAENFQLKS